MSVFIPIPETTLPNGTIVPAFQVGQYACSKSEDGKATVTAEGTPWVNINFADSKAACEASGYKLITETQWLAIAWNASQQDCNWTKGKVGEGKLFSGIRKANVSSAQPGNFEPSSKKEQRWLTLSNGERICDLNGNILQWVFDDIQGNENGLTTVIKSDSPSLAIAPFPPCKKGMGLCPNGQRDWSGYALIRGSSWHSGRYAGAFYLFGDWPGGEWDNIGFRCTNPGL